MGKVNNAFVFAIAGVALAIAHGASAAETSRRGAVSAEVEGYVAEPMPPGFQVVHTEQEGPVFADANGRTLYHHPFRRLRLGQTGDRPGQSACTATKVTETGGHMEPYPPGLELPDLDIRATCVEAWPPALASADAKPVGAWTIIDRADGGKQWALRGQALYTSARDRQVGDVNGATRTGVGGRAGGRAPVAPATNLPPGFSVRTTVNGRLLQVDDRSVYTSDRDGKNKSNCTAACLDSWKPVEAPSLAKASGDFSVFEREPGIKQWAYRGKPLYIQNQYSEESTALLYTGEGNGWQNVFTQRTKGFPSSFSTRDSTIGVMLSDSNGKTIYIYNCFEDTEEQLNCDYPESTQVYRIGICGNGDPAKCLTKFPYVRVAKGETSASHMWTVLTIDPMTGRRATADQPGAIQVWAYRDRPVYTFSSDKEEGDILGDAWGESEGEGNGYVAFTLKNFYF